MNMKLILELMAIIIQLVAAGIPENEAILRISKKFKVSEKLLRMFF